MSVLPSSRAVEGGELIVASRFTGKRYSGPVPKTPKNSRSGVDLLKRYLSITTDWVQKGVMVQPAIWPIALPPSKVRGTFVKSPGPTRRWEPKISS